jgi:hypothetical protein
MNLPLLAQVCEVTKMNTDMLIPLHCAIHSTLLNARCCLQLKLTVELG